MSLAISISVSPSIEALFGKLGGNVRRAIAAGVGYLMADLEAHTVEEAPVDTTTLVNSITHYLTDGGFGGVLKVTAPYAGYVHGGTGIYGPKKKEIVIRPKNKKALWWPGARHPVKKVVQKGQKPNPFVTRGIRRTDIAGSFEEGLRNSLKRRSL